MEIATFIMTIFELLSVIVIAIVQVKETRSNRKEDNNQAGRSTIISRIDDYSNMTTSVILDHQIDIIRELSLCLFKTLLNVSQLFDTSKQVTASTIVEIRNELDNMEILIQSNKYFFPEYIQIELETFEDQIKNLIEDLTKSKNTKKTSLSGDVQQAKLQYHKIQETFKAYLIDKQKEILKYAHKINHLSFKD